jgi:hypothetical protein
VGDRAGQGCGSCGAEADDRVWGTVQLVHTIGFFLMFSFAILGWASLPLRLA